MSARLSTLVLSVLPYAGMLPSPAPEPRASTRRCGVAIAIGLVVGAREGNDGGGAASYGIVEAGGRDDFTVDRGTTEIGGGPNGCEEPGSDVGPSDPELGTSEGGFEGTTEVLAGFGMDGTTAVLAGFGIDGGTTDVLGITAGGSEGGTEASGG